ncbi:MAG TPA: YafY family protein [Cyclobacteriaceae bacterium]|jgi:predicted DNA-binding transcriptional regulator YafY|nr:YafY family transcriptional regulator [Cytophagales bacterium]HNT51270.1 YafY family protein [Cyclobacteriaceae bacterium]HRE66156.1 YafY family protein [Cyclobacteriaceae bacterium]HRF32153.1 YafY family protein [Cyclobacteriaceae bacterium]
MNRIDRLTAILIHLQTKRVVKADEIAERFGMSLRTVYRDVKALMEAGVPIGSEAGKGYFIVDGFHLPPVMFTQDEANSMILAGKLVEKIADKSVREAFNAALYKIKSVLSDDYKDGVENLDSNIQIYFQGRANTNDHTFPDHFMTEIQRAVARKQILKLDYVNQAGEVSQRLVEPAGIFFYSMAWHLIAWCRLRNGYRDFRSDRIKNLNNTGEVFNERSNVSLKEYFKAMYAANQNLEPAVVIFDKKALNGRPLSSTTTQVDLGDRIRAEFVMDHLDFIARWLLMYGKGVEIESPNRLRERVAELTEELYSHHIQKVIS